jgi:hypothetical protein
MDTIYVASTPYTIILSMKGDDNHFSSPLPKVPRPTTMKYGCQVAQVGFIVLNMLES